MIEKEFQQVYKEWSGKNGFIECPKCKSQEVARIAVAHEGNLLICCNDKCKNQAKIGSEDSKVFRRGLLL